MTKNTATSATTSKLDTKLMRYALAAGAVLGAPVTAKADLIYSGLVNEVITGTDSLPVDFNGSVVDFTLTVTDLGGDLSVAAVSGPGTTFFVSQGGTPAALTFGDMISIANATGPGGDLIRSHAGSPYNYKTGNWGNASAAYLGVSFQISGSTHYGWAQITADVTCATCPVTLIDYGYQSNAGVAIAAGATPSPSEVPEPSSLALFALGAVGIAVIRRARQKSAN